MFTSYSCTYLAVRQRRINYVVGMTSTVGPPVLFQRQGLYASMVLTCYLTPALIYGWFRWNRDSDTRPVTNLTWRSLPVYHGRHRASTQALCWSSIRSTGRWPGRTP